MQKVDCRIKKESCSGPYPPFPSNFLDNEVLPTNISADFRNHLTFHRFMRHFILLAALSRVPLSALDQTDGNAPSPPQNTFMSIVMTLLPILLIALFIWFFFYKVQRKQNKRTEDYIARNAQHME